MLLDSEKRTPKTVLIADDNPIIRQMLSDKFRLHGFLLCDEAEDGRQAIKVAKECKPDLVVLDLSMPVMNGIEAAPAIHAIAPAAPIILFTMFADQLKGMDLSSSGISATFSKNDPLDSLLEKAQQLMARSLPSASQSAKGSA
jgi:DNA-binding NarL/FixJ family response regulator